MQRKPHSEATKLKLSKIHKGKSYHDKGFQKGHGSLWNKDTAKKVSDKLKAIGHKPNTNGNWKGGKIDYLKKKAKERDDYTCQVCGLRDDEIMQVDHIRPKSLHPELYEILENLLTLCPNCHARKTIREKRAKIYGGGRPRKMVLQVVADIG